MVKNKKGKSKDLTDRLNEFASKDITFRKLKKTNDISEEELDKVLSHPGKIPFAKKAKFTELVKKAQQLELNGMQKSAYKYKREAYNIIVSGSKR